MIIVIIITIIINIIIIIIRLVFYFFGIVNVINKSPDPLVTSRMTFYLRHHFTHQLLLLKLSSNLMFLFIVKIQHSHFRWVQICTLKDFVPRPENFLQIKLQGTCFTSQSNQRFYSICAMQRFTVVNGR